MKSAVKSFATQEDLCLLEILWSHPDFCTIDEHGNLASPEQQERYRRLQSFVESRNWEPMVVKKDEKLGLWNQFTKETILDAIYESFSELPTQSPLDDISTACIIARRERKWGVVSSDGTNRLIVPFVYDNILRHDNGWFILESEKKLGLSTSEGESLLPCCADKIWYDAEIGFDLYMQESKIGLISPRTDAIFDYLRKSINEEGEDFIIASQKGRDYYLSAEDGHCIPIEFKDFSPMKKLRLYNL